MAKRSRHFTQHACRALYSEKSRAFGQGFSIGGQDDEYDDDENDKDDYDDNDDES